MARATTSKTRAAEKSKPPATQTQIATTQEIVTGKFDERDWNRMLEDDSNEEFISEIVDELIQTSLDAIYKKYIDHQLLPFTITQARDAILEIIQWQFLARDEGEKDVSSNPGWVEDSEPEPADTDCWAQGSMPKSIIVVEPKPLEEIPEISEDETYREVSSVTEMGDMPQVPVELPDTVSDTDEIPRKSVRYSEAIVKEPESEQPGKNVDMKGEGKRRSFKTKYKNLVELEVKKPSDENREAVGNVDTPQKMATACSSFIKTLLVHPTGTKDAVYDEFGNVIAVAKLDPEKLPTHKVNVKFTVTDPTRESELKLEIKKKNQATSKQKPKAPQAPTDTVNKGTQSRISQMASDRTPTKSATPKMSDVAGIEDEFAQRRSMIEEIEVSQGIIIRENGRVKKGPGRYYRKLDILEEGIKGMKPMSLRITNPGITVADLLDRRTPILRSYAESPPLPPIVPHHPQQAKQIS